MLEEALVWFITKETSGTLFQMESHMKLAQAVNDAHTTSGQEDGNLLSEAHGLGVFNGSQ